jgi:UDP-glucuronate 4-epimerase
MNFLISGSAGFIGFHLSEFLLKKKHTVYGVDDLNSYYDVKLKKSRLDILKKYKNFVFFKRKIEDIKIVKFFKKKKIDIIINLAAQAGVRHSLENPYVYINSNILGQVNMLELAKELKIKKYIYASSSSVYGGNKSLPFSVKDRVDNPISLYAASKKSTELIAEYYSHLYKISSIGLRFFTVYGPWGRPDMATFIFTKNILNGKPINIFNYGKMKRDFTYVDDIISGIYGAINFKMKKLHKVYNLGNSKPESLLEFIKTIEKNLNKKAKKNYLSLQPGDVPATFADISESTRDLKFLPKTEINDGIPRFIEWFKRYYKLL